MQIRTYDSPVAKLYIASQNEHIIAISFSAFTDDYLTKLLSKPAKTINGRSIDALQGQLNAYFSGRDPQFKLQIQLHGTEFQHAVWTACASIPFGETRSYGDLARSIGKPRALRAVGMALGANPLPLIIPCHRVIGSNGKLTGFAGGLDVKKALLELELKNIDN